MSDSDPSQPRKLHATGKLQPAHSNASAYSTAPTTAENLILPDGPVDEETAELLEEFVGTHEHRRYGTRGSETEEEDYEIKRRQALPWWKRPSPYWLLCSIPFSSFATSSTLAPKVEVYTMLACRVHKPDIYHSSYGGNRGGRLPELLTSTAPLASLDERSEIEQDPFWQLTSTSPSGSATLMSNSPPFWLASSFKEGGREPPSKPPPPCSADPTVQAAVAKISASVATVMGVLSLMTTGWWGAWGDRHGRTRVLGISLIGVLITDFVFIVVYWFAESLPGNYWFLLVGALLEGTLGGLSTGIAANHAYISDTSTDGTRARFLSLNLGLMFLGMFFGPSLGSLVIRATGLVISVFYISTALHCLFACLIFTVLPEPLSERRMKLSALKYEEELRIGVEQRGAGGMAGVWAQTRRLFKFLSPLTIFIPELVEDPNPLKRKRRDWNLTFFAVAYGFTMSVMALFPFIFQFVIASFGWTSEFLGYWLSFVGAGRALWLAVFLPIIIKLLKPKPLILEIPAPSSSSEEEQPLLIDTDHENTVPKTILKEFHSPRFELGVALFSYVVDVASYGLMCFAKSEALFWAFGLFGALGIGVTPALQTVGLALYTKRGGTETGRLFGALSVVQTLSAQILGPAIYGAIFIRTVATFPRAIFVAGTVCLAISMVLVLFVKVPTDEELKRDFLVRRGQVEDLNEEGAVTDA